MKILTQKIKHVSWILDGRHDHMQAVKFKVAISEQKIQSDYKQKHNKGSKQEAWQIGRARTDKNTW